MSTRVNQERLASVVGRALLDKEFAAQLQKDPEAAAKGIGVHLECVQRQTFGVGHHAVVAMFAADLPDGSSAAKTAS